MNKARILVVEDEFITGADLQAKLQDMGYDVPVVVDTGESAVQVAGEQRADLVLMDIHLKGAINGIEAAEQIQGKYSLPVIFLTGQSDEATVEKAKVSAPFGYLIKPVDDKALRIAINMALYKHAIDENLKKHEQTIEALLNATTDALFILDRDGTVLALNEALARRAGKQTADIVNTSYFELIPSGAISTRLAEEIRAGMGGKKNRFEEESGGRWYDNNICPIMDSTGAVTMVAVFSNDITRLKQEELKVLEANKSLEKERERLLVMSSAIDTMDDIVVLTDSIGTIEYVNAAFVKKIGSAPGEVLRRHISELQNPGDPFAIDKNAFIARSKDAWSGNITLKNKYGLKIRASLRSSPVVEGNRLLCRTFVFREQL
ncbi:MAG: two-component response regulator [Methanoregula sp. PtaU1.Bin051]|nr:MAG: two-component response regulator [Methanoregula sp. PtaU1.Bin051]